VVNNGGNANLANTVNVGAAGTSPGHEIIVSDPGSVLSMGPGYGIWMGNSEGNRLVVTNGGRVNLNSSMTVSSGAAATNNSVLVTGANSMLWLTRSGGTRTITIGSAASASLLVMDQGIVELSGNGATGSALATGAYGVITNWGGVFQFAGGIDANQMVNGTAGSIVITNGTVSFRAVTTADVFCNQGGQPLDSTNKLVWLGDNTFRLNSATNVAGQTYTFQTGSSTNFAGLSLINGSRYRGNVTVGTGGTLSFSDGPETMAGNLTMQSGGTMAWSLASSNDTLTVTGAVNLAGATLQVALNTDPTLLYPIRFLRTGGLGGSKFSTSVIEAQYRGTNYGLKVRYDANNKDVLLYDEGVKGTLILMY
jgi:autotransporter family porin